MFKTLASACLVVLFAGCAQAAEPPEGSWSTPVQLTEGPVTWISAANDSKGNAIALWTVDGNLQSTYCEVGQSWPASCQACRMAEKVEGYSIAMSSSGDAMAVWTVPNKTGFNVYSAILPKGAPFWIPFGALAKVKGKTEGAYPSVGFDGQGNALAGWMNYTNGTHLYQSARFSGGQKTWTRLEDLPVPQDMNFPELRVSQNGTAVLAWLGSGTIHAARLGKHAGSWSVPTTLSEGFFPSVGIDKEGNALILWASTQSAKAARGAYLAAASDTWETLEMPADTNGVDGWFLIDMNAEGQTAVVWEGYYKEKKSYIKTALFFTQTKSWSPVATLHRGSYNADYYYPQISIDETGNQLCTWVLTRKGMTQLHLATCPQGGSWSSPLSLEVAQEFYANPLVTNGGDASILYLNNDGIRAVKGTGLFSN